jgi:phosphatidylglycerophosphate synthase
MARNFSGKPIEVEGVFDTYLIRPLGNAFTRALKDTSITPNAVSWLSVVAAFAAAVAYYNPGLTGAVIGTLFLLLSSGLDAADGQLARTTGRTSEIGETLDGFCDGLSFSMMYVAATLSLIVHSDVVPGLALTLGVLGFLSLAIQSPMVEFERQVFIYIVQGGGRIERDDLARLRAEYVQARQRGETFKALLRWLRLRYCELQQWCMASTFELLRAFQANHDPDWRARFGARYREAMRSPLHGWALMASNSHKIGIVACAFVPVLIPDSEFARYGLGLVLAFNLALNLPLAVLIWMQRRIDRRLLQEIRGSARAMPQARA